MIDSPKTTHSEDWENRKFPEWVFNLPQEVFAEFVVYEAQVRTAAYESALREALEVIDGEISKGDYEGEGALIAVKERIAVLLDT